MLFFMELLRVAWTNVRLFPHKKKWLDDLTCTKIMHYDLDSTHGNERGYLLGHLYNAKRDYLALQRRHDQGPAALPASQAIFEALQILYSQDEARIAAAMPWQSVTAQKLSKKLGDRPAELEKKLLNMADKNLVFDLTNPRTGQTRFILTPPVVGFIEFSLMRIRDDIDQKTLAKHLHEYLLEDKSFADAMATGKDTVIGRALVNDDALGEDITEVLDYERAEYLIEKAGGGAVSLCYCRHKAQHVGQACQHPQEICTTLQPSAAYMIRHNLGRAAEVAELKDILAMARVRSLVQIADNVQNRPAYICHCCGCCCVQLRAISQFGLSQAVKTTSMIARVDPSQCKGCGKCARLCPIGAITLVKRPPTDRAKSRLVARVDQRICLGCMVCHSACNKHKALAFPKRSERVLTPRNTLERVLLRAIEKGAVHHLLFGSEESKSMTFLHRFLGVVEKLPSVKKLMLSKQVKSHLLQRMMGLGKQSGMKK
jgi:ferredoxin